MFAKIFASIFDSSIADDWQTRVVFQDMLVLADKRGIVDMTPASIARRTNLPLEIVQAAIPKLEGPDASSRTPDNDGRRIVRLDAHRDWGWKIVNFTKYRESATNEMLRMAEAERKRAYRAKFGKSPSPTPPTTKTQIAEAEAEAEQSQTCPGHVPDKSPCSSISRLEDWQLEKDLKSVKNDIKAERLKGQAQNSAVIRGMFDRKQSLDAEKRRRYSAQSAEQPKTETPPTKSANGEPLRRMTTEEKAKLWNLAKASSGLKT